MTTIDLMSELKKQSRTVDTNNIEWVQKNQPLIFDMIQRSDWILKEGFLTVSLYTNHTHPPKFNAKNSRLECGRNNNTGNTYAMANKILTTKAGRTLNFGVLVNKETGTQDPNFIMPFIIDDFNRELFLTVESYELTDQELIEIYNNKVFNKFTPNHFEIAGQ